jgi:ATP-binding cassette subfamily B (MDR/TAP) protein 1
LASGSISRTSAVGVDSIKANESAISIFEILDSKSKIDSSSEEGMVVTSVRGDIEFQNVSFSYPLRPNVQIFNNLSLSIPSGKVTFYLK